MTESESKRDAIVDAIESIIYEFGLTDADFGGKSIEEFGLAIKGRVFTGHCQTEKIKIISYFIEVAQKTRGAKVWEALFSEALANLEHRENPK